MCCNWHMLHHCEKISSRVSSARVSLFLVSSRQLLWDDLGDLFRPNLIRQSFANFWKIEDTFKRVSFKDDQVCSPLTLSHVYLLNCSCFLEHYQPLVVNELFFCLVTGQEEFRQNVCSSQLSSVKQLWKPICFPTRMRPPSYGSTAVSEVWQFPRVEIQSNFLPWAWLPFLKRRRNQKTRSTIWFFPFSLSYLNILKINSESLSQRHPGP